MLLLNIKLKSSAIAVFLFSAENAETAEMTEKEKLNRITESVISAAIEVHLSLGAI